MASHTWTGGKGNIRASGKVTVGEKYQMNNHNVSVDSSCECLSVVEGLSAESPHSWLETVPTFRGTLPATSPRLSAITPTDGLTLHKT